MPETKKCRNYFRVSYYDYHSVWKHWFTFHVFYIYKVNWNRCL